MLIEELRKKFTEIVKRGNLLDKPVEVKMRPLKPHEALGYPSRDDYPLLLGKEVLVEATFMGAKGQAYTDEPYDFLGTLNEVISLKLETNRERALFIATSNAVLRYLGIARGTIHCKDTEPEKCGAEIAERLMKRYGPEATIGLIGLQPAIAENLILKFGAPNIKIVDLDKKNIGKDFHGVTIQDGRKFQDYAVSHSFLALATGSSIVNNSIDRIISISREDNQNRLVIFFGVTIAGAAELLNLKRLCLRSH